MSEAPKSFKDLSEPQREMLTLLADLHPEDLRRVKAWSRSMRWWEQTFWFLGKVKWVAITVGTLAAWFFGFFGWLASVIPGGE